MQIVETQDVEQIGNDSYLGGRYNTISLLQHETLHSKLRMDPTNEIVFAPKKAFGFIFKYTETLLQYLVKF